MFIIFSELKLQLYPGVEKVNFCNQQIISLPILGEVGVACDIATPSKEDEGILHRPE